MIHTEKFSTHNKEYTIALLHSPFPMETTQEPESSGIFMQIKNHPFLEELKTFLIYPCEKHSQKHFLNIKSKISFTKISKILDSQNPQILSKLFFEIEEYKTLLAIRNKITLPSEELYSNFINSYTNVKTIPIEGNKKMPQKLFLVERFSSEFIDKLLSIKNKLIAANKVSSHEGFIRTVTKLRHQIFDFRLVDGVSVDSLWQAAVESLDMLDEAPLSIGFEYTRDLVLDTPNEYVFWAKKMIARSDSPISPEDFNKWMTRNVHKILKPNFKAEILVEGFKLLEQSFHPPIPTSNPEMDNSDVFNADEGVDPFMVRKR